MSRISPAGVEQLVCAGKSAGVGVLIGLALHRLITIVSAAETQSTARALVAALFPLALMVIAVPGGQVALGRRGLWLAAVVWPIAILVGSVVILGLPIAR